MIVAQAATGLGAYYSTLSDKDKKEVRGQVKQKAREGLVTATKGIDTAEEWSVRKQNELGEKLGAPKLKPCHEKLCNNDFTHFMKEPGVEFAAQFLPFNSAYWSYRAFTDDSEEAIHDDLKQIQIAGVFDAADIVTGNPVASIARGVAGRALKGTRVAKMLGLAGREVAEEVVEVGGKRGVFVGTEMSAEEAAKIAAMSEEASAKHLADALRKEAAFEERVVLEGEEEAFATETKEAASIAKREEAIKAAKNEYTVRRFGKDVLKMVPEAIIGGGVQFCFDYLPLCAAPEVPCRNPRDKTFIASDGTEMLCPYDGQIPPPGPTERKDPRPQGPEYPSYDTADQPISPDMFSESQIMLLVVLALMGGAYYIARR